jgi:hypothetical protein
MSEERSSKAIGRAADDRLYPKYREAMECGDNQRACELLQVICARNPKDAGAKAELGCLEGELDVLRVPDAEKIAACIESGDAAKWTKYFGGLAKWAASPTWKALAADEFGVLAVTSGPAGAPLWVDELTGGGNPDRGMAGLARLAREAGGKPLDAAQWKRFDHIAGYLKFNKVFADWGATPFPDLAGRALRRNLARSPADRSELKTIFGLRFWGKEGFAPVLKSEVERALKIAGSLEDFRAVVDALRSRSMKPFGSAFEERVEFYATICLYWLDRKTEEKGMQARKLKQCLADLDGYGEPPEILRNAIEAKLAVLDGASASPGGDVLAGDPGGGDSSIGGPPYSGPRCVRRVVKYGDLVKGKVGIPLLAHLVKTRKKKVKEGGRLMWVNLKDEENVAVCLDGVEMPTLAENESCGGAFWLGGVLGGVAVNPDV